jgi:VanZ family protein
MPRWLLNDKVLHTLAFGLGTVLLCRVLHFQTLGRSPRRIALCSALAALGYGIADELHQARVPQRTADVADVVADGLGAALAAWGWLHGAPRWFWLR